MQNFTFKNKRKMQNFLGTNGVFRYNVCVYSVLFLLLPNSSQTLKAGETEEREPANPSRQAAAPGQSARRRPSSPPRTLSPGSGHGTHADLEPDSPPRAQVCNLAGLLVPKDSTRIVAWYALISPLLKSLRINVDLGLTLISFDFTSFSTRIRHWTSTKIPPAADCRWIHEHPRRQSTGIQQLRA
jgi:hypothetical protein